MMTIVFDTNARALLFAIECSLDVATTSVVVSNNEVSLSHESTDDNYEMLSLIVKGYDAIIVRRMLDNVQRLTVQRSH